MTLCAATAESHIHDLDFTFVLPLSSVCSDSLTGRSGERSGFTALTKHKVLISKASRIESKTQQGVSQFSPRAKAVFQPLCRAEESDGLWKET
ncbi:hypothetical protein AOLI_G00165240 [Acnodon oligacanthus]